MNHKEATFKRCFVLGGARSGKSRLAETYAKASQLPVTYIATAQAQDKEMAARIACHQAQRPSSWQLVESPLALASAIKSYSQKDTCILIDCLTLWLSNWLCRQAPTSSDIDDDFANEKKALIEAISNAQGILIIVSNEVGHGIVPMGELSRVFVDQAGWLHQEIAAVCDRVEFVMAGIPLTLKTMPIDSKGNGAI